MTFLPPDQPPPVLLDIDFASPPGDFAVPDGCELIGGRLRVSCRQPDSGAGAPLGAVVFRDVVFETQLRLREGDSGDRYGVFARRAADGRFMSCTISPDGVLAIRHFAGANGEDIAVGDLAPGMSFAPGLDQPNLFHVVACGPQLTFVLNGMVLMGVTVAPGLAEGEFGIVVEHGAGSPGVVAEADWTQVRAVLPPLRRAG